MDGDQPRVKARSWLYSWNDEKLLKTSLRLSWFLFFLWPLQLPIELAIGIQLLMRKSKLRRLPFLLSSTTVMAAGAVFVTLLGYFTGCIACCDLSDNGEPGMIGRFSPRYRCNYWRIPESLSPLPISYLIAVPNSFALRTCYAALGPVKRRYHGPLPDAAEAKSLANSKSGQQISLLQFKSGSFVVSGGSIHIPAGVADAAVKRRKCPNPRLAQDIDTTDENVIYVELYKGSCLILITPAETTEWMDYPKRFWIISLVDPSSGKLITQEVYSTALAAGF